MAYNIHWYDEAAGILQIDIEGTTSWEGYHEVIDLIIAELKTTTLDRIDVIVTKKTGFPSGNPIPHIQRTHRDLSRNEKMGRLVVVNGHRSSEAHMLKVMSDIVMKTAGTFIPQMRLFVDTLEEAAQLIEADRTDAENSVQNALRRAGASGKASQRVK